MGERVVFGEVTLFIKKTVLDYKMTFTRASIANGMMTSRSNRPIVNTSVGMTNAGANAIASISKGFDLGIPTNSGLRVACVNVGPRAIGTDSGVGVTLASSGGSLSRIVIANCNGFGGSSFANTTTSVSATGLDSIPSLSIRSGLSNGVPKISVSSFSNRPNTVGCVHVHNVNSVGTNGSPLVIVSNAPIGSNGLDNFGSKDAKDNCGNSNAGTLSALGDGSVRSVAIVGSTTTTSLCNSHTTGNILIVAAGDNDTNGARISFHDS